MLTYEALFKQSLLHDPSHVPTLYCYSQLLTQFAQKGGGTSAAQVFIFVSSYSRIYDVSSYSHICVLILVYMCPRTRVYVSSYSYVCVLTLVYMCPHTSQSELAEELLLRAIDAAPSFASDDPTAGTPYSLFKKKQKKKVVCAAAGSEDQQC